MNLTAQKIREGNWVKNSKGEIIRVESELAEKIEKRAETFIPLEITEEILLENGFKKYDMDPNWIIYLKDCVICRESPYYPKKGNDLLPFTIFKIRGAARETTKLGPSFHIGFDRRPAYLHQFQNVYKDLLNEELVVVEKSIG